MRKVIFLIVALKGSVPFMCFEIEENSLMNRITLMVVISFVLSAGTVSAASYKDGFTAYSRGDYPSALKIL